MAASKYKREWEQSHTLYVILQGEFVLYQDVTNNQDHDTLRILAPNVDKHQYKAGPWCQDWNAAKELPKDLYLHHATGDRKHPEGNKMVHSHRSIPEDNGDIIMHVGPETLHAEYARLDIRAPMPLAILPGLCETTDGVEITVWDSADIPSYPDVPNPATLITILLYKWYGDRRPFLDSPGCDRKWHPGGPDDFLALHIYASSDFDDEDPEHAKSAFRSAAAILGARAEIEWPDGAKFPPIYGTPPAGLSWEQVNWFFYEIACGNPCENEDPCQSARSDRRPMAAGTSNNCGPITGG